MIIVDYADLLRAKSMRVNEKRHQLESIYEELRANRLKRTIAQSGLHHKQIGPG
jgi:hypothetical protein